MAGNLIPDRKTGSVGHVPDYIIDLLTPAASDPSRPSLYT